MLDRTKNKSGTRWMVIGKILCLLWGKILDLLVGFMLQYYLLVMMVVDTCFLCNIMSNFGLLYVFFFCFYILVSHVDMLFVSHVAHLSKIVKGQLDPLSFVFLH